MSAAAYLVAMAFNALLLTYGVLSANHAAMNGLSLWTWSIATLPGAAWVVHGFADGLLAIAIPNLAITPICASILGMRLRHEYRGRRAM